MNPNAALDGAVAAAESFTNTPDEYNGECDVDGTFVVLEKNVGKRLFDESSDSESQRRTELEFRIHPISEMNLRYPLERSCLAESAEFAKTVWPSLRDLGLSSVREIDGKWVTVKLVENGRTWKNKNGETVKGTTLKFLAIHADRDACVAAYEGRGDDADGNMNTGASAAENDDSERGTALEFLRVLAATKSREELEAAINNTPMFSAHFTIDSPEVRALLS